jgi:hypothetical protein
MELLHFLLLSQARWSFPYDLEELRQLPEYKASSEYWDRALSEIELTAPGASRNGEGDVIVFREKKPDERGIRAFHEVGGSYGFTEESATGSPKPAHPAYIGG